MPDPSCRWTDWQGLTETLRRFEAASIPREEWTHGAHVAVACWYVLDSPETALDRMRSGIQSLNEANGIPQTPTGGYHETITVAYIALLREFLQGVADLDRIERVHAALGAFNDKKLLLRYYSRDRIMSEEARYGFLEPDLEPLPHIN